MLFVHNNNFATRIPDQTFIHKPDPHIKTAKIASCLGHQTTKTNALRRVKLANIVVYKITLLEHAIRQKFKPPKTPRPNVNSIDSAPTDDSFNAIIDMNYNPECRSYYDSSDDNVVASIASTTLKIESRNSTSNWNYKRGPLDYSESVCSILNE